MKRSVVVAGALVVGALLVAGGLLAFYKPGDDGTEPPEGAAFEPIEAVEVVEAREVSWQPTADLVGTVFPLRAVAVRNELPGVIKTVGFDSGSIVEQGQVILTQDDAADQADLEAAKAAVRVAEASVHQSESRIRLAELLFNRLNAVEGRAISEADMDRARSELDTAKSEQERWLAEVDHARALVAQVDTRIAKLTIKAPFRARAGMRMVHEGQYLAEGADVVSLQELTDRIYLDFAIPQEYAPRVAPGTVVMATGELLGPDPVRIDVVAVDAIVNRDTRNLRVRAIVDNARGVLVPGMAVQIRVPVEQPSMRTVVPSTAVRRAAYGNSVFVVAPDEANTVRASQRFVKLGPTIGEDVVVLEGLKPGERIGAAGSFKLHDGVKVMVGAPAGQDGPGGSSGPDAHAGG